MTDGFYTNVLPIHIVSLCSSGPFDNFVKFQYHLEKTLSLLSVVRNDCKTLTVDVRLPIFFSLDRSTFV